MSRRTAMLRFSDAEFSDGRGGTVEAHQRIISSRRSAWWGWWKKAFEPFPRDLLEHLCEVAPRTSGGIRIGLVNRKAGERLYVARCVEVAFSKTGDKIPSPEPMKTPGYYRKSSFPSWFRLENIEEVDQREFCRLFGRVPFLDSTLYAVFDPERGGGPDDIEILPRPEWTMTPIDIASSTVLHISDLHFGQDHGYPTESIQPRALDSKPLWELISDRLIRELNKTIGVVVVSGDLVTRAGADDFVMAAHFLERLLNALNLTKDNLVVVPGNHDIWVENVDNPTRNYSHENPYRQFIRSFFGTDPRTLERVRRYRTPEGDDLIFVELNSARVRSDALKSYGYISRHRYIDLLRYVKNVLEINGPPSGRYTIFAVLHHHLLPVSEIEVPDNKHPVSITLDAGEIISTFQEYGVRFALHGHQHAPFVGTTARISSAVNFEEPWCCKGNPLFVLGSGSTGAKWDRIPQHVGGNTYSTYTMVNDVLQVVVEKFGRGVPASELLKVAIPVH